MHKFLIRFKTAETTAEFRRVFEAAQKSSMSAKLSNPEGLAFLNSNAAKEGVCTLNSGLQYKIEETSSVPEAKSPSVDDPCVVHYHGTLIDGTVFDSSRQRGKPATFAPSKVIKGWREALQLMREGDRWTLYIPAELAYGEKGYGKLIKPGDVLIFDLMLDKVNKLSQPSTENKSSVSANVDQIVPTAAPAKDEKKPLFS
eukprot:UC1_evm1s902